MDFPNNKLRGYRKNYDVNRSFTFVKPVGKIIECEKLPFSSLRFVPAGDDTHKVHKFCTDVNLLFHQQDLEKTLGVGLRHVLNSFRSVPDVNQSARDKFTDEQHFNSIRSRFVQTPSEVQSEIESLNQSAEKLASQANSKARDVVNARVQQIARARVKNAQNVQNPPESSNT